MIANGGLATYEDCMRCLEYTGCDGVMSSESILEYAALFDNSRIYDLDDFKENMIKNNVNRFNITIYILLFFCLNIRNFNSIIS